MMIQRIVCLYFLTIIFSSSFGQDGRWQPKGHGWIRLSQTGTISNSYFDSNADALTIRTNSLFITSLSGEYGLSKKVNLSLNLPVFARATVNGIRYNQSGKTQPGSSLNSVGDAEISLRYGFLRSKPFQINAFIIFGVPFGKKGAVGSDTDIQTGDGEFNQIAGIQLRHSALRDRFFVDGYIALNNRTQNFSNEVRYGFSAGVVAIRKFSAVGRLSIVESLFNDTAPVSLNGIFSNHREYVSTSAEIWYNVTSSFSIYFGGSFYLSGRNTLASPSLSTGIEIHLMK